MFFEIYGIFFEPIKFPQLIMKSSKNHKIKCFLLTALSTRRAWIFILASFISLWLFFCIRKGPAPYQSLGTVECLNSDLSASSHTERVARPRDVALSRPTSSRIHYRDSLLISS